MKELPMTTAARTYDIPLGTMQHWIKAKLVHTRRMHGHVLVKVGDIESMRAEFYTPGKSGRKKVKV